MNRSTPGLPVHHQLPEFTQTCVHQVSDAIQPSHPQSSPSSPAPNPSQHQDLFQWVRFSHQVVKVLEFQHQSFQWLFRVDISGLSVADVSVSWRSLSEMVWQHPAKIKMHSYFEGNLCYKILYRYSLKILQISQICSLPCVYLSGKRQKQIVFNDRGEN